MWIKFENGNTINLAQAVSIFIDHDKLFYVTAAFPNGNTEILNAFDNEDSAKKFVAKVVDVLNGNKPLGYAFNWLKSDSPKLTEKVESDEKHKDEILQDGLWF